MKLRTTLINYTLIFCALLFSGSVMSNTINVPNDYSTIQAAISAASSGDIVLVQPGTYNENINFNGKAITVGSLFITTSDESYITSTIINGGGSRVVKFSSGESSTSILSGFTITNGYAYYGAGIYCNGTSPTLSNLIVESNNGEAGDSYGGGLCCLSDSNPTCSNITFSDNYAQAGGAVYCHDNSHPTFNDCIFTNNNSNHGGAVLTSYSHPLFNYCVFYNNTATSAGAAMYIGYHSHPTFTNCTVVDNSTPGWGGGFYCNDIYGEPNILNCIVWGNTSDYDLQIFASGAVSPTVTYTDVQDGTGENWFGTGCLDTDPLFVDAANNDYHLTDASPCINAGDPASPPDPDGSNADQGAFPNFEAFSSDFYGTPTNVCEGSSVVFTDNSVGDPTSWSWTFEGGTPETSDEQNPTVVYNTAGEFDVTLTISNGTDNSTLEKQDYITVDELPTPEIIGATIVCKEQEFEFETENIEGNIYEWTVTGGEITAGAGTNNIIVLWGAPGTGSIELSETSNADCIAYAETHAITIDDCTGYEEIEENKIAVFPNPATNFVTIKLETQILSVKLIDITGKILFDESINNETCKINTSSIESGMYILSIKTNNSEHKKQLIIE